MRDRNPDANIYLESIAEATGLSQEAIMIHATHTHTGGSIGFEVENELTRKYSEFLRKRIMACAQLALADLKPAKMGRGVGYAPNIAFVRRFRM